MNPGDDPRGHLREGISTSTDELASLKQQMQDMQMEIDILKETINVLKKDPGAIPKIVSKYMRRLKLIVRQMGCNESDSHVSK